MNPPTGLTITAFYSSGDWAGFCQIKWTSPTQPADAYYRIEYHHATSLSGVWTWQTDVPPDQSTYGVNVQFASAPPGGTPKSIIVDQVRITAKDVAGVSPDASTTINMPTSLAVNHVPASNFAFICNGKIGDNQGSIDFTWNDLTMFLRNGTITLYKYGVTSPGTVRILYNATYSAAASDRGPNRARVPILLIPQGIPLDSNLTWDPLNPPTTDSNAPFWVVEGDLLTLSISTTADDDPQIQSTEFTFEYHRVAGIDSFSHTLVETMADSFTLAITQDPYLGVPITAAVAYVSGLPTGLSFNSSTLVISGTPTVIGTFFPIFNTTSKGHFVYKQQYEIFVISVQSLGLTWPTLTAPPSTVNLTVGVPYDPNLNLYGPGSGPYEISAGVLPAGLSLNAATGAITGTPTGVETQLVSFEKASTPTPVPPTYMNIVDIIVVSGGDYFVIPGVVFDGGGQVKVPVLSIIVDLLLAAIRNGGSGYTVGEVLTVIGGVNTVAAQITIDTLSLGGSIDPTPLYPVASVPIVNGGQYGFTPLPPVIFIGGSPHDSSSGATATVRFGLSGYQIVAGGTGYAVGNVLTLIGGTGVLAQLTVDSIGAGGSISPQASAPVTGVPIISGGSYGYTAPPQVTFTGGGQLFSATATSRLGMLSYNVVGGGSGYIVGDALYLIGGTYTSRAQIIVDSIGPGGSIATSHMVAAGSYTVIPGPPTTTTNGLLGGNGAELFTRWTVVQIVITNAGAYTGQPIASVPSGTGSPSATLGLPVMGTVIAGGAHVSNVGAYTAVPPPPVASTVSPSGGTGFTIIPIWTITQIIITAGGYYEGQPVAEIGGSSGFPNATVGIPVMGTPIFGSFHISSIGNYTALPANPATFSGSAGSGATADLHWEVNDIVVIDGGKFSSAPDSASLSGPSNTDGILGDITMVGVYSPGGPWGPPLVVTFNVVEAEAPVITSPVEVHFIQGQLGTYVITTDAGNDYWRSGEATYWKVGSGELPEGMFLKNNIIYGVPTDEPGVYPVYLQAGNGTGYGVMFWLSLWVDVAVPVITSPASETAKVGQPFFYQIVASGNPFFYGADGLPDGLEIGVYTGIITGVATGISSASVKLAAINSSGAGTATLALTTTAPPVPVIDATALTGRAITLQPAEAFVFQPSASNNPTIWTADPLTQGLTFDPATGRLSGQFITEGFYSIIFVASNAGGDSAPVTFYFVVGVTSTGGGNGQPPPPAPVNLPFDVVDIWVDLDTSAVSIDGPTPSAAAATVKRGDTTVIAVIFHRAGVPQDINLARLFFGAKVAFDDDDYIVYTDSFTHGTVTGRYSIYPDFSDQNNLLDSLLTAPTIALLGEIQWDLSDGTRRSTQTFAVSVLRDLIHPDPAPL